MPPAFFDLLLYRFQSACNRKCFLVGPICRQGIVNIDNLQNPGGNGNRVASKSIRVARAIKFLMMMSDNRKDQSERFQWRADAFTYNRMLAHDCPFVGRQASRLKQN